MADAAGRHASAGLGADLLPGGLPESGISFEFPSRAAAESWYGSPEYQKLLPVRLSSSSGSFLIVDGVD